MRMSHSSANLFQGCQRRFYYKKNDVMTDPDYEDDSLALRIGKAFHGVQEDSDHKPGFSAKVLSERCRENDLYEAHHRGLVLAMCMAYTEMHEESKLTVRVCEIEIGDDDVIGYIDAVMVDKLGGWYIVDLKTASRIDDAVIASLANDPQLNLYASYYRDVADRLGLHVRKFKGIRYRVTTKPKRTMKANETVVAFAKRLKPLITTLDVVVKAKDLDTERARRRVAMVREHALDVMAEPEDNVLQNFGYCNSYFRPCPWWSRCHGKTYKTKEKMEHDRIKPSSWSDEEADLEALMLF